METKITWRQLLLVITSFAIIAAGIYGRSLQNEFVLWDDDALVYENPLTQELSGRTVWGAFTSYDPELYVPLTIVSYQFEHAIGGFNPFLYHLSNLLLHLGCTILAFLLLLRLGLSRSASFLMGLLFLVHPMNTEAVAWVSARKDLLCALFSLSSLLLYLRWKDGRTWMGWSLLCFLLALLSKVNAAMLPLMFLLIEWKENGTRSLRIDLPQKSVFAALSLLFLAIGMIGKARNLSEVSVVDTILLACKSFFFHLLTYTAPVSLSLIYRQSTPISLTNAEFWIPVLLLIVLLIITVFSLRRTRVFAFAAAWYALFLLPSFANFSKAGQIYIASDRYVYLAQIGVLMFLGWILDRARSIVQHNRFAQLVVPAIPIAIALILAPLTYARSCVWESSETLFTDVLAQDSGNYLIRYNLGIVRERQGDVQMAEAAYREILQLQPDYGKAHNSLGTLLRKRGDIAGALEEYEAALRDESERAQAYNNIGSLQLDQGKIDEAIATLQKAIALQPAFVQAYNNLGVAYGRKGLYREGLEAFYQAASLDPMQRERAQELRMQLDAIQE